MNCSPFSLRFSSLFLFYHTSVACIQVFGFFSSNRYPRLLIQKRDISAVNLTIISYSNLSKNSSLAT